MGGRWRGERDRERNGSRFNYCWELKDITAGLETKNSRPIGAPRVSHVTTRTEYSEQAIPKQKRPVSRLTPESPSDLLLSPLPTAATRELQLLRAVRERPNRSAEQVE